MFVMSISFLGAGIKELIEGDVIVMSSPVWLQWIPSNQVLDVLGIYPIAQTIIPQLILLAISVVIFVRTTKKNNLIHMEAEALRAKEQEEQEEQIRLEEKAALEAEIRRIASLVYDEKIKSNN